MKHKLLAGIAVSAIVAGSYAPASFAQTYKFVATDGSHETRLCVRTGNNDVKGVKSTLRKMGIHDRKVNINTIRCNDLAPAKFAYKYQADNTFNFLNKYSIGKNKVNASVTIRDVAKTNQEPKIIYVSAAN
ncbi:DUF3718 domain-containing protein [Thalassotalea montiporae]